MRTSDEWDERYQTGTTPWDTGRHDRAVESVLARYEVPRSDLLELGCGTGTNAMWFADQGCRVTATDISRLAIDKARRKAKAYAHSITFIAGSILDLAIEPDSFDLAFDRGCFHSIPDGDKEACVARVHDALRPGGHWLSLMGSADAPPRDVGPPMLTARQVVGVMESLFEIRLLEATHFDSDQENPAPAWICLMRRRG